MTRSRSFDIPIRRHYDSVWVATRNDNVNVTMTSSGKATNANQFAWGHAGAQAHRAEKYCDRRRNFRSVPHEKVPPKRPNALFGVGVSLHSTSGIFP